MIIDSSTPVDYHSLRAVPAHGGGITLAWQDREATYATVFRGTASPAVTRIEPANRGELRDLVALPNGYLLVFAAVRLLRVSASFEPIEERRIDGAFGADAEAIGNNIFLGYARPVIAPEYEGISRAFVRQAAAGPRRRVVR